jgi:hypothetical protein
MYPWSANSEAIHSWCHGITCTSNLNLGVVKEPEQFGTASTTSWHPLTTSKGSLSRTLAVQVKPRETPASGGCQAILS